MSTNPIGMGAQDQAERQKYEDELQRIIDASSQAGIVLRVIGSLAFQMHCPNYGYLQAAMGRSYTDLDFAGYRSQAKEARLLMTELGYSENQEVFIVSEGDRAIFTNNEVGLYVDVFYDKLDFCHEISWNGRLEIDSPTIPLAEMLLEKMQIVKINEKDVIDTIMLLLEHELGDNDHEVINIERVAQLCAKDWGLWRTTSMNLEKVKQLAQGYPQLKDNEKVHVAGQVDKALSLLDAEPKTMGWKLRARVGDRIKWYKDVDEV
jgi:hypothetical protein